MVFCLRQGYRQVSSGKHSSDPHRRGCGVAYNTDTQERVWLPSPGIKQSVYRTEFLSVVRALEECQPNEVVSDCKGKSRLFKPDEERHRDLEKRALAAILPGQRI
eukprot:4860245-Amphidinium_carterae.4